MAQWKRAGLITQRSVDILLFLFMNHASCFDSNVNILLNNVFINDEINEENFAISLPKDKLNMLFRNF